MKKQFVIIILILTPFLLLAQSVEKNSFTLAQAQAYALENSVNVKNATLDTEIAKKKVWETTAIGLPQVSGGVDYQNTFTVPEMSLGGYVDWQAMDPMTPVVPADVLANYVMGDPIELGVAQNVTWNITVSQLIFSGEYIVGLQAAKTYRQISELSVIKTEIELKKLISETYVLVQVLTENKNLIAESLTNTEKLLEEMQATNKAGLLDKTSVDQFQLTVYNLTNALSSLEKQVETMHLLLKYQMGMDINQEIELTESAEDILFRVDGEHLLLQEFSIGNHIDYQILETQEKITTLSLKREKATILPTLSAFYQHQEQVETASFSFFSPDMIGVSLSIPLFSSGGRYSKIQQSKLELIKIQNTKADVESALNMQVVQNKNSFITAQEKHLLEKRNLELAKTIYENTLIMFRNGSASSLEVTQAQNQMLTSQTNYYNSIMELLQAKNNLDKALNNY
jgi:outer membrane protein